jgi:ribonuclease HII
LARRASPARKAIDSAARAQLGLPLDLPTLAQARGLQQRSAKPSRGPLIAGVDEAGRGPLAGPVVAAAVLLDDLRPIRGLADSKALTAAQRERLFAEICDKALCFCIAEATVKEIDELNILRASLLAMQRAVVGLRLRPLQVWVDGNHAPELGLPTRTLVRGDALEPAISAASILAKVHRDRLCAHLHERFPDYGFASHKGYPTAAHLQALRRHGPCAEHRTSYAPVRAAMADQREPAAAGDPE